MLVRLARVRTEWIFQRAAVLASLVITGSSLVASAQDAESLSLAAQFDLESLHTQGGWTAGRVVDRVREVAPSIERAREALRSANAGAIRALLGFSPRLTVTGGYTRVSPIDLETMEFEYLLDSYRITTSLSYSVTAALLDALPSYLASSATEEAADLRLQHERRVVTLAAQEAFYQYVRTTGALAVAQASAAQAEFHRQQTAAFVAAGRTAEVDLRGVEAELARAQVAVAQARAGLSTGEQALRRLLRLPSDQALSIGEDLTASVPTPSTSVDALVTQALTHRIDRRALERTIEARDHEVDRAVGNYFPDVAVSFNYDLSNPNNRVFPQREEFVSSWDFSVLATISANDVIDTTQAVRQADAAHNQAESDLTELDDTIRSEVREAYDQLAAAQAGVEAAAIGVTASEETYRVRLAELRAGRVATRDLIDAEGELVTARLNQLNAALDLRIRQAKLTHAIGADHAPHR